MFTDEVITLMAIEKAEKLTKKPTNHSEDMALNQIGDLCDWLVGRGYLVANGPGEYQLTWQGRNAILREIILLLICEDESWAKNRIELSGQLYDEISQQIDGLKVGNKVFG